LTCSSKDTDCRYFVAKGRYKRARDFASISTLSSAPEATAKNMPPAQALLL